MQNGSLSRNRSFILALSSAPTVTGCLVDLSQIQERHIQPGPGVTGILHFPLTVIQELLDFRGVTGGRNSSAVHCRASLTLHPSLGPCLRQRDLTAALIRGQGLFPHPLYLGWTFNLLDPHNMKRDSVSVLSHALKKIRMPRPGLLDPWLCHEKRPGSTCSKARSSNQGHPRPTGPQVTYQDCRHLRNKKRFLF